MFCIVFLGPESVTGSACFLLSENQQTIPKQCSQDNDDITMLSTLHVFLYIIIQASEGNHIEGIMRERSWRRNSLRGRMKEEKSWRRNHRGIMKEESMRNNVE